ncbi:MAG: hypothetical protein RSB38_03915 [Oscillospiraceae bacterium]
MHKENKSLDIVTEEGQGMKLMFKVVELEHKYKPYGIEGTLTDLNDEVVDKSIAENRFATEAEALANIEMLLEFGVTPATLENII